MKNKEKGDFQLLAVLIIVAAILVGVYLVKQTTNVTPETTSPTTQQTIQTDSDLMTASVDLDSENLNTMDSALNQNDADVRNFAPRIRLKNGTSTNWSGYAVETDLTTPQVNVVNDVKGGWVVPNLTCTSTNTYSAAWVGIDGDSNNTVEQTGTEHDCVNGQSRYSAWYEMYPKPSFRVNLPIKPGDSISAEVKYAGSNKFTLTLKNNTTGQTFTTTQKSNAAQRQSAEWVMEAPWSGGILPLANFGTMPFNNAQATLNGRVGTINDTAWQNDQIIMTDSSGNPKATPSSLSTDGSSFTMMWNAN